MGLKFPLRSRKSRSHLAVPSLESPRPGPPASPTAPGDVVARDASLRSARRRQARKPGGGLLARGGPSSRPYRARREGAANVAEAASPASPPVAPVAVVETCDAAPAAATPAALPTVVGTVAAATAPTTAPAPAAEEVLRAKMEEALGRHRRRHGRPAAEADGGESEDEDEEEEDTDTLDSDSRTELDSDDESDDEEDSLADTLDGSLDDDTAKDSYGSEDDGSVLDRSLDPSVSVAKPRKTSRDRSQRAGEAPHSPDSAGTPATASTGGDSGRAGSARGSGCARQRDVYCKRRGGPERMVVRQHPEEPGPAKPDDVLVRVVVSAVEGAGVRLPSGSRVVAGSLPPDRQACSQIAVIRLPW